MLVGKSGTHPQKPRCLGGHLSPELLRDVFPTAAIILPPSPLVKSHRLNRTFRISPFGLDRAAPRHWDNGTESRTGRTCFRSRSVPAPHGLDVSRNAIELVSRRLRVEGRQPRRLDFHDSPVLSTVSLRQDKTDDSAWNEGEFELQKHSSEWQL